MLIRYDLSAAEILSRLGYSNTSGQAWLQALRQKENIELPQTYCDFMAMAADSPLFRTSNLWCGISKTQSCQPHMFYEELQESLEDYAGCWSQRPSKWERSLYKLSQLPRTDWPQIVEDYLVIGSDFCGGTADYGIRKQDLAEKDPPVYLYPCSDCITISGWKKGWETLSDFLLSVLVETLSCVDYDTAERAIETIGWHYEEYFDMKKYDWVASNAVVKRQGIDPTALKKYKVGGGRAFCCYDEDRNAFFIGRTEDGELSLSAINRQEANCIFPDTDSLEFCLEYTQFSLKHKEEESEEGTLCLYVKDPSAPLTLSDICRMDLSPERMAQCGVQGTVTYHGQPLYMLCSKGDFVQIIRDALKKNPKATKEELLQMLNAALQAGLGRP